MSSCCIQGQRPQIPMLELHAMLSLLCVKGKEKGDVALKPIKLSISTRFMKWKHLAWGEKQYENKSHVNWYLEQLKNQIPKHLNKLFLVYMRQQCGTDLRERGQDKPPPPPPPAQDSKILVHIPTPKPTKTSNISLPGNAASLCPTTLPMTGIPRTLR